MRHTLIGISFILFSLWVINESLYSQNAAVRVIDNKGTINLIDTSKWKLKGTDIYNKNLGNVGIGNIPYNAKFMIDNGGSSTLSALKLKFPFSGLITDSLLTWNAADSTVRKIRTASLPLLGDVIGTLEANTVSKLQGTPISTTTPIDGQLLQYATSTGWTPTSNVAWFTKGNTGLSSTDNFIGTNDNIDFVTKTNGSERMRVTAYGQVGIGTDNPHYLTDVAGALRSHKYIGGDGPDFAIKPVSGHQSVVASFHTLQLIGKVGYDLEDDPIDYGGGTDVSSVIIPNLVDDAIGLIVQGSKNQTADILQIQSFTGNTPLFSVSSNGSLGIGSGIANENIKASLHNSGSTILGSLDLSNFSSNNDIGTASATVDSYSGAVITQSTSGISVTLPSPTASNAGRIFQVSNKASSSTSITVNGVSITPNQSTLFRWDGTSWNALTGNISVNIQGTNGGIFYGKGTGVAATFTAAGTTGQILQSNGAAAPTWVNPNNTLTTKDITTGTSSSSATNPLTLTNAAGQLVGSSNATLTVNNTAPLWNANKLQGTSVSSTAPTTTNKFFVYDGTNWGASPASALGSIGLSTGVIGTDVSVSGSPANLGGTLTINIPTASGTNRGALSSTDWTTFNNKQNTITLTTTGSSGSATFNGSTGALNIPNYTYTLPAATASTLGGVKIGTGISVAGDGTISTTNNGTVTQVTSGNLSPLFSTSVATNTTTPAISYTLSNAGSKTIFGNNTASSTTPNYFSSSSLSLAGDVTGTLGASTVGKIQGITVSTTAPTNGQVFAYNSTTGWTPTAPNSTLSKNNVLSGTTALTITNGSNQVIGGSDLTLNIANYSGATSSAAGTAGLVNPAASGQQNYVLQGNGTWISPNLLAWQPDGNTNAALKTLGTKDNYDLPFISNNKEAMRISSVDQTLGLGTSVNINTISSDFKSNKFAFVDQTGEFSDWAQFVYGGGFGVYNMISANGTMSSPTALPNGAQLGGLNFVGHNGSTFKVAANIGGYVDGTPTSTATPGKLEFHTTDDLGNDNVSMEIRANGNVGIGIGNGIPGNRLEIGSSSSGNSGLRFTNLNSGSTPSSSNNLALSVNPSGDVILVPSGNSALTKKDITTSTSAITLSNNTGQVVGSNNMTIDISNYVGATSSTAGTAGLVKPATAGQQNYFYKGDGTWVAPNSVITMGIPNSASTANAATISGSGVLQLSPADATNPGIVTTGTQTIAGNKTLTGALTLSGLSNSGGIQSSDSLMVLDKATNSVQLISPKTLTNQSWSITGNSGTTSGTNFIGTTDNVDIILKRNSVQAGLLGSTNTAFGLSTFGASVSGTNNTALGYLAGNALTSGNDNIAIGHNAMALVTTTSQNVVIGKNAMSNSGGGYNNVAVGYQALLMNTWGGGNTALGYMASSSLTSGNNNTAIGINANAGVSGSNNIAIGSSASVPTSTLSNQMSIGNSIYGLNMGQTNPYIGINTNSPQATLHNAGSTVLGSTALPNFTANAAIGTAATTVDTYSGAVVTQTTSGITLTLPNPTNAAAGRIFQISNASASTSSFTVNGTTITKGSSTQFRWDGASWNTLTGIANNVPISGLTAATSTNSFDNSSYPQTWTWNSLTTANTNGLTLSSSSAIPSTSNLLSLSGTGAFTGNLLNISGTSTTGNTLNINATALTTGNAINISGGSALTSGSLIDVTAGVTTNTTNGLLYIGNTAATSTGKVAIIQANTTSGSGLNILANGNVGIGYATPTSPTKTTVNNTPTTANATTLAVNGIIEAPIYTSKVQTLTDAATITWDVSLGSSAKVSIGTANRFLNITNIIAGQYGVLVVTNTVGSATAISSVRIDGAIVSGSTTTMKVINGGGSALSFTPTANAVDIISFFYDGSVLYWTIGNNYN